MSNPRHLWSGDWELDSAAAREELAKRRAQVEEPAEIPIAAAPPPRAQPQRPSRAQPQQPSRAQPQQPSIAALALAALAAHIKAFQRTASHARRAVAGAPGVNRQLRIALLVALVALVSAAAAFAVTTMLVGSSSTTARGDNAHALLGIDVTGSPLGITVTKVAPGGAGNKAGLLPGDRLTSVNGQPVGTVDAVNQALIGLSTGDTIQIQFTRGVASFTSMATLAPRPPGYP
jgi:membrane-associated protease RseP (regulator of RpoE activity)